MYANRVGLANIARKQTVQALQIAITEVHVFRLQRKMVLHIANVTTDGVDLLASLDVLMVMSREMESAIVSHVITELRVINFVRVIAGFAREKGNVTAVLMDGVVNIVNAKDARV